MGGGEREGDQKEEEMERIKIENEQMKVRTKDHHMVTEVIIEIFAESIRQSGSELERRAEEMNRKLIGTTSCFSLPYPNFFQARISLVFDFLVDLLELRRDWNWKK